MDDERSIRIRSCTLVLREVRMGRSKKRISLKRKTLDGVFLPVFLWVNTAFLYILIFILFCGQSHFYIPTAFYFVYLYPGIYILSFSHCPSCTRRSASPKRWKCTTSRARRYLITSATSGSSHIRRILS